MSQDPLADMHRWLVAEGHDEATADAAFRSVFGLLPRFGPPPAFSDRVVAAAQIRMAVAAGGLWGRVWLRLLIGLGLMLTGLAVLGAAAVFPTPDVSLLAGTWVALVASGAARLGRALDVGLSVWRLLGTLGNAAVVVAAAPAVSLVIAGNGVLALVAFLGLRRLMSAREEMLPW